MGTKLTLTYGLLIAHFIPGASLALLLLFRYCNDVDEAAKTVHWASQNPTLGLVIGIIVSLAAGLILDGTRYTIIQLLKLFSKKFKEWDNYDMLNMSKDDITWHEWIIENRYRFHQLFGNFSIIFLISLFTCLPILLMVVTLFLFLICLFASIFSYRTTVNQLRKRFPVT